jgi:SRSO17 transposase
MTGVPIHRRDIIKQIGSTEFAPGTFHQRPAARLCPHSRHLKREERARHLLNMIWGLPGDSERESPWPMAHAFARVDEVRNMARFVTPARRDDDGVPREFRSRLAEETSGAAGVIDVDGRDVPKKDNKSAGVQRRHRGPRSKVDDCQAGVMTGRAGDKGRGLVNCRPRVTA